MNERNMRLAMRRMGVSTEEMKGVQEVVIRLANEELVIENPEVTVVTMQGVKTYQVAGETKSQPRGTHAVVGTEQKAPPPAAYTEEDVELVMGQAGVDRDAAVAALVEAHGEPAEAIMKIMSRRG
jgi:nascent polypeptide-associated complex subunit alpha